MATCPFAVQQPIESRFIGRIPMEAYNRINDHITAGLGNPFGFFNGPAKASSHFCVMLNGIIFQYQDTAFRAEGDLDGNDATICVEHEGRVGPMPDAQREASIRLTAWLYAIHGFKAKIAVDSKIGESSHGLSWHRLGIDGNFPALPSPLAGRLQRGGGMHYSRATGKTCPTEPIILLDIPRIASAVFGGLVTWPNVPPIVASPTPVPVRLNPYGRPLLREDGRLGPASITEWQMQEGTVPDGYINGQRSYNGRFYNTAWSSLIHAAQGTFGTKADGVISYPKSGLVRAMQAFLGTGQDSYLSWPVSTTVAALQSALNTGRYPR